MIKCRFAGTRVGRISERHIAAHKTKAPQGRFSLFPVFVFRSIPLVHGRVSPDINTPQSSTWWRFRFVLIL
ncbi:hypothetical protein HMPREF0208_02679 [Citrobacter koseri]|nr:hypothetical protein HMPREF3220_03980 [Citrobacter koseri]KXA01239.1 hypothetical protein HMPREF3207_02982 [Citrobacter koseri]KXB43288.1 hypothetical protein HMPREF0208_02679 [Citrobacter koseri]